MDKAENKKQEGQTPPQWVAQFQVGVLTVVNTYIFFTTVDRFQNSFYRIIRVQTPWTLLLGILYSLFFLCIFGSYASLFLAVKGEKDKQNNEPIPAAYSLFIGSLIFYLFIELLLNLLIAKNII